MIDKVMVFPQAYAAVVPKSSMVVNMLRVFVVDIGGYTTDVLLLKTASLICSSAVRLKPVLSP